MTCRRAGRRESDPLRSGPIRPVASRKIPAAHSIRPSVIAWKREGSTARIVAVAPCARLSRPDDDVTYRDVDVDLERRTITLRRPLVLDLGAVAKGLAVDAAARELQPFKDFAIDAGGDLVSRRHEPSSGRPGRSAFDIRESTAS